MSTKPIVSVTRLLPDAVLQALSQHFTVRVNADDVPLNAEALRAEFCEADAVLCTVTDRVEAACFTQANRRARIVANFGVGVNHIELDAATAAGVMVTNTPDVLTDDTADLAMLLMLSVLRRAGEGERELRSGNWTGWRPTHLLGTRLTGKTLGVVGFGRIGAAVARRAREGFGMRVYTWTRSPAKSAVRGVTRVSMLDELLTNSDVVSLHVPATAATKHLIGTPQFAKMRPGAILVNTSRGDVVDENALVQALERGQIGGAGLDVYEAEPRVHSGLLNRNDVVLLPHIGSATRETRESMGMRALANLQAFFSAGPPPDRVA